MQPFLSVLQHSSEHYGLPVAYYRAKWVGSTGVSAEKMSRRSRMICMSSRASGATSPPDLWFPMAVAELYAVEFGEPQ